MKKAIVNRTSRRAVNLSQIVMAPKKGLVTRVILMPAVEPRHVEAVKIADAVRVVAATRITEANFSKPAAKKTVARKLAVRRGARKLAAKKVVTKKPVLCTRLTE